MSSSCRYSTSRLPACPNCFAPWFKGKVEAKGFVGGQGAKLRLHDRARAQASLNEVTFDYVSGQAKSIFHPQLARAAKLQACLYDTATNFQTKGAEEAFEKHMALQLEITGCFRNLGPCSARPAACVTGGK